METVNQAEENMEKIAQLFPNCVTEIEGENGKLKKAIDFDKLKQMMADHVREGEEAYEFTWVGKKAAIMEANRPIRKTLRPCVEESKNWDTTENLYIEGDNLEALKLLQESYLGKVKMIYIDPPYNTGNDFVYNDDFKQDFSEYEEDSGNIDEDGNRMKVNHDNSGRFHSSWCSMIFMRLLLARNLLTEDGVIFISIDDNEQENLKKICNDVFGEKNFIAQIIWEKVHTRKNSAINFSSSHEYILVYAKKRRNNSIDKVGFKRNLLPRENTDAYTNPDDDPKGPWKTDPITAHNYYAADYTITKPNGVVIRKPQDRYWAYSEETIKRMIAENAIVWGNGDSMPLAKRYLCDVQDGLVPTTIFARDFAGDTSQAKKQLDSLFPDCKGIFDYTKPVKLLNQLLHIGSNSNDIILDFFSGSSTMAQAVMEYNLTDNGHRKFIMVQIPQECGKDDEAYKYGYKNICEIGKERIRRAGEQIKNNNPSTEIDRGFRVLKIDTSIMNDIYYSVDDYTQDLVAQMAENVKYDRTALDLLFSCLTDWGIPLSLPYTSEEIDKCTVHNYNAGDLIACFDKNAPESVVKHIAKMQPMRAVFRDSSFADSSAKINVTEIFKLLAPDTEIRVL